MKLIIGLALFFNILTIQHKLVNSKRLFIIVPVPYYSHQIAYQSLWRKLHERGHELVILTLNSIKDPNLANYTEINYNINYENVQNIFNKKLNRRFTEIEANMLLDTCRHYLTEKLLKIPDIQKLFLSENNEKFDAVMVETLSSPIFYLLAQKFNAPLIGIMSLQLRNFERYFLGSPILSSHLSNWEIEDISTNPTFWQRLNNFINTCYYVYYWFYIFIPIQQMLANKYLGDNVPSIIEAAQNMSLILANSHMIYLYSRPEIPNVVYYNNGHISKIPPTLPTDLRIFLDNATNGFIYMSLGSTVKYDYLMENTKTLFWNVLSKLPWPVVWSRSDADSIKNFSYHFDKIFISKWVPQQGILAHPNIKLFIYQGGLQSTEEAIYYGVPLIGIPIIFDQEYNVKRMATFGVAKHLHLINITEKIFNDSIYDIFNNKKRYKEKMLELQNIVNDVPYDTLENAVWWIEYVIRNKGIPYLQLDEKYKPYYQRYDIDIIVLLSIFITFLILFLLYIVLTISSYIIIHYRFTKEKLS
ncbi:UDP-glucuronosyltransferase 2B15-like isoform X1 [Vespa mandarinia]|uniref:UDP-glucuronosyltransferase 2B15-like isoform X1 n=1 Tax=Vespa mandarinia TaxID=7446 RepID=UPI00161FE43E|nr:UDP-glucuronosyltransferase 2B15-like isoform X1 [Vespa mandarinia]